MRKKQINCPQCKRAAPRFVSVITDPVNILFFLLCTMELLGITFAIVGIVTILKLQ